MSIGSGSRVLILPVLSHECQQSNEGCDSGPVVESTGHPGSAWATKANLEVFRSLGLMQGSNLGQVHIHNLLPVLSPRFPTVTFYGG